ncbi:MAG TPA: FtsX-like permease family protein [Chthoniobacterales bacterium]|nr:FtsX-like permease family protein [Chthoniobacterales bacterium]
MASKSGEWFAMRMVVRDFKNQQLSLLHQHGGAPPQANGIFIEQSGQTLLEKNVGDELQARTSDGEVVRVPIAGFLHDTAVAPSTQDRAIYAYVSPDTAAILGQNAVPDQLLVKMQERGSADDATEFSQDLSAWLTKRNLPPLRADVMSKTHPHAALMSTMLRVLEVLAAIAFTCSAALAAYLISLWMKREARQVGIMKAIGARFSQIASQYLALVAPVVLASFAFALPIGTLIGRWVVKYYETSLNIDVADWTVPASLILKEAIFALGIPFLAMAFPIVRAAKMSARKAIQDPGIVAPAGPISVISKMVTMPGNRRLSFALRNTFRRPWRLTATLLALSAGGALLLTAYDTYESLMRVVDVSLANQGHDVEVQLQRPVGSAQLESVARAVPDVEIAEAFRRARVNIVTGENATNTMAEGRRFLFCGYPPETRLVKLPLQEGRWPRPDESDAVVVNRLVQNATPGLQLGHEITLKFRARRAKVRVVGLVEEIGTPTIYGAFPAFEAVTALGDSSQSIRIKTAPGRERAVANALDQALLDAHLAPSLISTRDEFRTALNEHFAVVTAVMKMIALAAALIGAISLIASVSLSVLERAREIGVIRALGATPRAVVAIFLIEGSAVALLSALLSIIGSVYFAQALNNKAAHELLHVAVPLYVSRVGLSVLFSGAILIVLAVWLSVGRILRLSVREALAYE